MNNNNLTTINDRIKQIREHFQMSQEEFASGIGLIQATYSLYERGKRKIPTTTIIAISNSYNISKDWIYTGLGEMFIKHSDNEEEQEDPLIDPIKDAYLVINKVAKSTYISPYKAIDILTLIKTMTEEAIKEVDRNIQMYEAVKSTHKSGPSSDQ